MLGTGKILADTGFCTSLPLICGATKVVETIHMLIKPEPFPQACHNIQGCLIISFDRTNFLRAHLRNVQPNGKHTRGDA